MPSGNFPLTRYRRNRKSAFIRDLVQEHRVNISDLIYPVFVIEGNNRCEAIKSLPGQSRLSIDNLLKVAGECQSLGLPAIALFPMLETPKTDKFAVEAYNPDGLLPRAVRALKQQFPALGVFTDIALDGYTPDGHDGITDEHGYVQNDLTNSILARQAVCHAQAGADFVCPSDMMDGRVIAIRQAMDEAGFYTTGIMAYSAKYASVFYGPFREATGAGGSLGKEGKKSYQMNPANSNEAIHEAASDWSEGADIVMIKPGLPYLDVLYRVKHKYKRPVAAYHVSGEYAMLKLAAASGIVDYDSAIMETMLCFKRAGADMIWTYAAMEIARLLKQ